MYDTCRSPRLRASNVCIFVISCKHPLLHVRICAMSCKISHNSRAAWRCATRAYLCEVVQDSSAVCNACVFARCRARFPCRAALCNACIFARCCARFLCRAALCNARVFVPCCAKLPHYAVHAISGHHEPPRMFLVVVERNARAYDKICK